MISDTGSVSHWGVHHYLAQEQEEEARDNVPDHYNKAIQPWDYMKAIMTNEAFKGYLVGNVIKYVSRFEDKGGVADIDKSIHYLQKLREVYQC